MVQYKNANFQHFLLPLGSGDDFAHLGCQKKNYKIFVNRLLIQLVDYLPYILANYFVKQ